jgi:chromosome condensin MukBEF MukE localization factor
MVYTGIMPPADVQVELELASEGKLAVKVSESRSSLRLMAIIWTASSDAARQACGEAAVRWGNAQAVPRDGDSDAQAGMTR